jgi:hypothetical protein
MSQLLDEAADALERRVFFDELSARYEVLRADPDAWSEIEAERTAAARCGWSTSASPSAESSPEHAPPSSSPLMR